MEAVDAARRLLGRPMARLGIAGPLRQLLQRHAPGLSRRVSDFHRQPDRLLLEREILPGLAAMPDVARVLFVGCDWYTHSYARLFPRQDYWTLEPDPGRARYGSRRHHVVGPLRALPEHVAAGSLDAIVCNGVFMRTAMETREEAEPSFRGCFEALRPGGWFVLGWNDTEVLRPYPPSESAALGRFRPAVFPGLGVSELVTPTEYRHVYSFYRRP